MITPARALGLTLRCPNAGVCVVAVNGELDTLTAPLRGACMRPLVATTPVHLILAVQPLRFLGVSGLTYLLSHRGSATRIA